MTRLILTVLLLATFALPLRAEAKKFYEPQRESEWVLIMKSDNGDFYYSPASIRILNPLVYAIKLMLVMNDDGRMIYEIDSVEQSIEIDVLQQTYIVRSSIFTELSGRQNAGTPIQEATCYNRSEDQLHSKIGDILIVWTLNHFADNPDEKERQQKAIFERIIKEKPELYEKYLKFKKEAKSRQ